MTMTSRRSYLKGAAAGMAGAALAACGASATPATPAADTKPVTIEYNVQSAVLWEMADKVVPAFNQKFPHITVQAAPDGGLAKLRTMLAGGTPPDTTWLNISDMPGVAEQLRAVRAGPVDHARLEGDRRRRHLPGGVGGGNVDGQAPRDAV